MPDQRATDRRARRTRGLLHGALASLIHEKPYDDIVVKEILARADVGRSTFYAHFRDKDELLAAGLRDLLRAGEAAGPPPTVRAASALRFSAPLFEHIGRHASAAGPGAAPRRGDTLHEHLGRAITDSVAESLRRARPGRAVVPVELLAGHVAGTFVRVLEWWLADGLRLSAGEADAAFRALVLPALAGVMGDEGDRAP